MSTAFAQALSQEIFDLEAEIGRDPRFRRLQELRRLQAAHYANQDTPSQLEDESKLPSKSTSGANSNREMSNAIGVSDNEPRSTRGLGRRASPERDAILKYAEQLVRGGEGRPVPTTDIVNFLDLMSLPVPGTKPINNVSAILSTSGRFVANGRRGWTMATGVEDRVSQPTPEEEQEAEDALDKAQAEDEAADLGFDHGRAAEPIGWSDHAK